MTNLILSIYFCVCLLFFNRVNQLTCIDFNGSGLVSTVKPQNIY